MPSNGWVFNNLTYLPYMTRAQWGENNLVNSGHFNSGGRKWRTECDTAATGRGACRSYIWLPHVIEAYPADGATAYRVTSKWVFNNLFLFA